MEQECRNLSVYHHLSALPLHLTQACNLTPSAYISFCALQNPTSLSCWCSSVLLTPLFPFPCFLVAAYHTLYASQAACDLWPEASPNTKRVVESGSGWSWARSYTDARLEENSAFILDKRESVRANDTNEMFHSPLTMSFIWEQHLERLVPVAKQKRVFALDFSGMLRRTAVCWCSLCLVGSCGGFFNDFRELLAL